MLTRATHGTAAGTKAFPDGILFLDIDPGQPELAAPGIIYLAHLRAPLLGPPFTNLIVPGTEANVMLRMHYIGSYSPRGSPSHYQNCVSNLVALHHNYEHLPLIVNICGWISGYGRTILQSTLQRLVLTDIFYVGDTPNELLDDLMQPAMGGDQKIVTVIPPQPNKTPLKSPSDLREMQLQSYVHALGSYHGHMLWDQLPVTTLPDTLPPASDDINEVFTVIILGQVIAPEYITDALHGSVAALVVIKHDSLLFELSNREGKGRHDANGEMHIAQTKDGQLPYLVYRDRPDNPLDPETSECIGLARVTVDTNSKQLGIKSPISEADMRNEIMKGYRIAVVLAQQQGSWLMMESI